MTTVYPPAATTTATRVSQPLFALLSRPHAHVDDGSDSESVAESSSRPCSPRCWPMVMAGRGRYDDDDGCSSCVEGGGGEEFCYQLEAAADHEAEDQVVIRTGGFWWEELPQQRLPAAAVARGQARRREAEAEAEMEKDPKRVAAQQEEDRKFWEDCLATGYP